MGNLYSVLRSLYREGDSVRLLNDGNYFLQQIATRYEPAFKFDCKLIERAVRQGAGNIISQYLQQHEIPDAGGTAAFLREMQNRAGFSASEAERAIGFLYYMVGWNEDGTTGTGSQISSPPQRSHQNQSAYQTPINPNSASYAASSNQNQARKLPPTSRNVVSANPVQPSKPASPPSSNRNAGQSGGIRAFLGTRTGRIVLTIVLYIVFLALFIAVLGITANMQDEGTSMLVFLLSCVALGYFGWQALSRIQPRVFLILPLVGWFTYFWFKGILSVIIGWFVAPYQIAKMIVNKL